MSRKQIYESTQLLEARILAQQKVISGLTSSFTSQKNKINPIICNSSDYERVLQTGDKIQAVSRYITDIPELFLPSNKLETLWYDLGSLCFYNEDGRPWVATFSKEGGLNKLGDLDKISPIDLAGVKHRQRFNVVYDNTLTENAAVIINDYTGTYKEEQITPRQALNRVSIIDQAAVYRQLKNSIKITAKKAIAILESETQRNAVESLVLDIIDNDSPVIGVVAKSLNDVFKLHNIDSKIDIEGYLKAIESYERLRANFNCIKTRSSLEKKERLITSEAENDNLLVEIYLYDGLINRQVGIELMKKHAIIKDGSSTINPLLLPKKNENNDKGNTYKDKDNSTKMEKGGNNE